jgi:acyl-CoA dehydrogenase
VAESRAVEAGPAPGVDARAEAGPAPGVDATAGGIADRARRVGEEVAGPASDEVDRDARFPAEAIAALRAERLLSSLVPADLGGSGASLAEVARSVTALARHCASTAMIYAMHQIQVACLVGHGRTPEIRDFLGQIAREQLLLASATTELGVGGDIRSSICAVEEQSDGFRLTKDAPVISYGEYADAILATCRRTVDSPPSDQVLVLCRPPGLSLEASGVWDTLGFRGTCSLGFRLHASGTWGQILSDPFGDISSQTMLPVSHIVWASVWLGIAAAAVERARRFVRAEARKHPGTAPPAAIHLAELVATYQQMEALVVGSTTRVEQAAAERDGSGMGFAIAMNGLKVTASRQVVDIVGRAMTICGMAGYREDSPYRLGRLLRDAHGAAIMVNNDRIVGNNAQMLLVHRDD